MSKVIIFGGTTEGRKLCEACNRTNFPVYYCVATKDGAHRVEGLPNVTVCVGRLEAVQMMELFSVYTPSMVIDATHPYAENVSRNITEACQNADVPMICILRECVEEHNCTYFNDMDALTDWLEKTSGHVFVTMGASSASVFSKLTDYQKRVWLRILPSSESLLACLNLGYPSDHLICMQGPFSEELNCAMFKAVNAKILVTKNSGAVGGFSEKVRAAQNLGMDTAVLLKQGESKGIPLNEAIKKLMELPI